MDDARLLEIAVEMRAAQRAYYERGRSPESLARARAWEDRFDRALAEVTNRTPSLFPMDDRASGDKTAARGGRASS